MGLTGRTYFRAAVISTVVAVIFPLFMILSFWEATVYDPVMDQAEFYQLSYEEQQAWFAEHAREMSALEILASNIYDTWFWQQLAIQFGVFFSITFVACCAMAWWERRAKGIERAL